MRSLVSYRQMEKASNRTGREHLLIVQKDSTYKRHHPAMPVGKTIDRNKGFSERHFPTASKGKAKAATQSRPLCRAGRTRTDGPAVVRNLLCPSKKSHAPRTKIRKRLSQRQVILEGGGSSSDGSGLVERVMRPWEGVLRRRERKSQANGNGSLGNQPVNWSRAARNDMCAGKKRSSMTVSFCPMKRERVKGKKRLLSVNCQKHASVLGLLK